MASGTKPSWINLPSSGGDSYYPTPYAGAMSKTEEAKYAQEKKEQSGLLGDMMTYAGMLRQADEDKRKNAKEALEERRLSHQQEMDDLRTKSELLRDSISMRKEKDAMEQDVAFNTIVHDLTHVNPNHAEAGKHLEEVMKHPLYAKALSSPRGSELGGMVKDSEKRIKDMRDGIIATAENAGGIKIDPATIPRTKEGEYDWNKYTTEHLPRKIQEYWATQPTDDEIIKQAQTQAMAYNTKVPYTLRGGIKGMADPTVISKLSKDKPSVERMQELVNLTGGEAETEIDGVKLKLKSTDQPTGNNGNKKEGSESPTAKLTPPSGETDLSTEPPSFSTAESRHGTPSSAKQDTYSKENPFAQVVSEEKAWKDKNAKEKADYLFKKNIASDIAEKKSAKDEFASIDDKIETMKTYFALSQKDPEMEGPDPKTLASKYEELMKKKQSLTLAYGFVKDKNGNVIEDPDKMDQGLRDLQAHSFDREPGSLGLPSEKVVKTLFNLAGQDHQVASELASKLGYKVDF